MTLRRCFSVLLMASMATGCASTIAPQYTTEKPDVMRIGERPQDPAVIKDKAGSFCLETSEKWHDSGKTPDGQTLWAKDSVRRVVPCTQGQ
jgi:hypothetical protein